MSITAAHDAIASSRANLAQVDGFLRRGGSLTIMDRIAVAQVYATLALAEATLGEE